MRIACISPLRLEICDEIRLGFFFWGGVLSCLLPSISTARVGTQGLSPARQVLSKTLFDPIKLKLDSIVQCLPISYSSQPLATTTYLWKLAYLRSLQYIGGNPVFITSWILIFLFIFCIVLIIPWLVFPEPLELI